MIRALFFKRVHCSGIPRESGDDPKPRHHQGLCGHVFPARAGMIRLPRLTEERTAQYSPRERG